MGKPNLNLVKFKGSKDNNIVLMHAHGAGIMLDEQELILRNDIN